MELKLFLGKTSSPSMGEWISLPMDSDKLQIKLKEIKEIYGNTIISDYGLPYSLQGLSINEHDDIMFINWLINQPTSFIALYIYGDKDVEYAKEFYSNRKFLFIEGVTNSNDLGEAIAKMGLVGEISRNLIDNGYINYEKIGNDFECSGIKFIPGLGAIGEVSEENFKKWKKYLN